MTYAFTAAAPLVTKNPRHIISPEAVRRPRVAQVVPRHTARSKMCVATDSIDATLASIIASPVVLCIRMQDPDLAIQAASAAIRGGLRCVEVTMTTPDAPRVITTLAMQHPNAVIGAGTVLTAQEIATAVEAGARFALSPVVDPHVIEACHAARMLAIPGAATPSECHAAVRAGAKIVKVFPIDVYGGMKFVKAMQGPLGHIPLLPTSGISSSTLTEYLSAPNVVAVGACSDILPSDALIRHDWDEITQRAQHWNTIATGCLDTT